MAKVFIDKPYIGYAVKAAIVEPALIADQDHGGFCSALCTGPAEFERNAEGREHSDHCDHYIR